MRNYIVAAAIVVLGSCMLCPVSRADSFQVTITTTPIQGQGGFAVFDFIQGAPVLNNTVTVSGFTSDAMLGSFTTTGAVMGTLVPGPLTLSDSAFLSEWSQGLTYGTHMSFILNLTTNSSLGGIPDEFSFFLEDSTGTPFPTSDPTGADALFAIDITGSPLDPFVFTSDYASATVTPLPVDEPSALGLTSSLLTILVVSLGYIKWRSLATRQSWNREHEVLGEQTPVS
jgi:hypothetical protein